MRILGISGKRGAGKDTLADFLVLNGHWLFGESVAKCAFADDLKLDILAKFRCDAGVLWGTNAQKEQLMPGLQVTYREAMRILGKAHVDIDPMYYTRRFFQRVQTLPFVVVSDVRFVGEAASIEQAGGRIIRLTRAENPDDMHPTETALDRWKFDAVIDNRDITVEHTRRLMVKQLQSWGWLKEGF